MSLTTIKVTRELYKYILDASLREPEILQRLRAETRRATDSAGMQISPEQGQFMSLLLTLMNARKVLELGVFTGYSSLTMALALPPDGKIVACDKSEEWTSIARRYWAEAGVAHKIDLRLGPAADSLEALLAAGEAGTFDFVFIDADKKGYELYYEKCLQLVRQGGLIAIDNVFQGGKIHDSRSRDRDVVTVRRLNKTIHEDPRVILSMLPISDGVTLALKL